MKKPIIKTVNGVDVEIHKAPESKHRKDSFWFDGDIASVTIKGRTFVSTAIGEIRVSFKPNGDCFRNAQAVKEARNLGFGDIRLANLSSHDGWDNNNWFTVYEDKSDGTTDYFEEVDYNYNDALETLVEVALEQTKK